MAKQKNHPTPNAKDATKGAADGGANLDLEIPHESIGELVEVGGVLVAGGGGSAAAKILEMAGGKDNGSQGGRACRRKSAKKLAKKWGKLAGGLPEPRIRASLMGGIVAEWGGRDAVFLEFSRKLKKAWIDVSSPDGDWGIEVRLTRKGWRRLGRRLGKILPDQS